MRPARAIVVSVSLGVGLVAPAARGAEGRTSSLSWLRMPGADACIATQALARAVEDRLGRPGKVFVSAAQADLSVEGRIEKRREGWYAVIHVRDAQGATLGTRELRAKEPSCDAMNEQLAFVIAVMIDPEAAMRERPTEPAPAPAPPAAPATPSPAPATAAPAPTATTTTSAAGPDRPGGTTTLPKAAPWQFEGGGALTVASGLTPSLAAGGSVEAILFPPGVPVGFRGFTSLFLPTTADRDGARASYDMLYAGGSICPAYRSTVNVLGCIGGELGLLRQHAETSGRGISDGQILPIWNAILEARISFSILKPIGASAGVAGLLPILRPTFEYTPASGTGAAELHKVSPIAFSASAGLGFVFP